MTEEQQVRLLKRLKKKMLKYPIPIPNKGGDDIPIVVLDRLVSDWVFDHISPEAKFVKQLIAQEQHKILSEDGFVIATKPWQTDLMATYVKADNDKETESKVKVPRWI